MTISKLPLMAIMLIAVPIAAKAQQYRPEPPPAAYRNGVPGVLTPPPAPDPEAASKNETESFRRWYNGAKKPAMMLFWNRELTDDTTTRTAEVSVSREETRATMSGSGGDKDAVKNQDSFQSKIASTEKSQRILTGGTYVPMDRTQSDIFESGFQQAWLSTGVELVDRNAMMRTMSLAAKEDRADLQLLEAAAMRQNVQYLVEVLPNGSQGSSTGYIFRIKVLHLPSSTVVAQFVSQGLPPQRPAVWMAGANGFEKRVPDSGKPSPEQIGAELAVETMAHLDQPGG